jgi:tRNA G18 (ribose-2'-O)-methylase SpoU
LDVDSFEREVKSRDLPIIGFEHAENSEPLETARLPRRCVLLFGNEGLGLTAEALAACDKIYEIAQAGSVRSINASAAGAIALYAWRIQSEN